ncbi:MAG: hypothetical protein ACTS9Y_00280 [Methylophilus sp.]|uniref:hypothetical protein n=1 Tax=Methylophilus sp. TaxID=29541 RepID=UPI003FA13105
MDNNLKTAYLNSWPLVKKALDHIAGLYPGVTQVFFDAEYRWCFTDDNFIAPTFEHGNQDISLLDDAVSEVGNNGLLPFVFHLNQKWVKQDGEMLYVDDGKTESAISDAIKEVIGLRVLLGAGSYNIIVGANRKIYTSTSIEDVTDVTEKIPNFDGSIFDKIEALVGLPFVV